MKITLEKQVILKEGYAYLELGVLHDASDIAKFLEDPSSFDVDLRERIKTYLKRIGIYDSNGAINAYGNRVKQDKKDFKKEAGKYCISFTQGDDIFGTRIFTLDRVGTTNKDLQQLEKLRFFDEYCILNNNEVCTKIKFFKPRDFQVEITSKEERFIYKREYEINEKQVAISDIEYIQSKKYDSKSYGSFLEENIKKKKRFKIYEIFMQIYH